MSNPIFVPDEIVTADKMNELPKGILGYAAATSDQTGITSEADVTGLSVTVDVPAGRRLKITGFINVLVDTVSDTTASLRVKESTTQLAQSYSRPVGNSRSAGQFVMAVITPSSGSHTYKLTLQREVGTGSLTVDAAADRPCFILVEDIGEA